MANKFMHHLTLGNDTFEIVDKVARSGNYITATTAAEMTETSAIYVYTGTEEGYNAGHLYYWDGTAFVDGGEWNGANAEIDATLSIAGKAADAKATGDAINEVKADLKSAIDSSYNYVDSIIENEFGFSAKAFISGFNVDNETPTSMASAPFVVWQNPSGYIITALKMNFYNVGTLSVGYLSTRPEEEEPYNEDNVIITNKCTITETGVQIVKLNKPMVLADNAGLVIGDRADTARWGYGIYGTDKVFLYAHPTTNKYVKSASSIGVDIVGIPIEDYASVFANYKKISAIVDGIVNKQYEGYDYFYNSYNASNAKVSNSITSPFMVIPRADGFITSFKININTIGKLSIGTIKLSDVVYGDAFDFTKLHVHETLLFDTTGEQIKTLSVPMELKSDELIVLNVRTDTAKFYYGSYGVDKKFYYVNNTTVSQSNEGLGVTFYGIKYVGVNSVYRGKSLSILGDSISTFSGYIPEGNATYYPSGTVQGVSDTWWHKLYTALGMTLNVNNSWSGSRVTTTAGETSAGCMTRAQNLGTNPDVIIVWMGINDFNNEVALGTYDGSTNVPTVTNTFREAYGVMLNKILSAYPSSEVWVCTLPQCERNAETGFPEINGNGVALVEFNKAIIELAMAFGVKVLDHNKCGLTYQNMPVFNPDNLHPNNYGHSLIANNDIRQIDNAIRTRYDVS